MIKSCACSLIFGLSLAGISYAQDASVTSITPVFGQLVSFRLPTGFTPVYDNANETNYIQEAVPEGETYDQWSQMITLTGAKDLALDENVTLVTNANAIADSYKKDCQDTFTATPLDNRPVDGHDSLIVFLGCGSAGPAESAVSESAVIVLIKGEQNYYTLQWAERSEAIAGAPVFDVKKWGPRLAQLFPVKLCPVVEGEEAPYPSCTDR
jgi:hypothetical protein